MSQQQGERASRTARSGGQRVEKRGEGSRQFAGVLLVLVGVLHAIQGLVALTSDQFFTVKADYLIGADFTTWGWAHLLTGVVAAVAGAALFRGVGWARAAAVIVATLSMFGSFLWVPYYPAGALVLVGMNVFIMWAAFADTRGTVR